MSNEPTPLTCLDHGPCACAMAECWCPPTEKVLRTILEGHDIVLNDEQREWCLSEIGRVEGYDRKDFEQGTSTDLARGVLDAWADYCRDKGLL